MDIVNEPQFSLKNLDEISVLLGRNGCGKSRLLRQIETYVSQQYAPWGRARYITPERGGALVYDAATEQNTTRNPEYLPDQRRANHVERFREQTMAQYHRLERDVLREYERRTKNGEANAPGSERIIDSINSLLDNIRVCPENTSFAIYAKESEDRRQAQEISSGESELISLAIECLVFARDIEKGSQNLLCLDEPDVHLHPDLQHRLTNFLIGLIEEYEFSVLIATHSTALVGALRDFNHTAIGFMRMGDTELEFRKIDDIYRKVLPVFGAHPLSNVFNEAPVLLVEGEDDLRIWQQAVRSSSGSLKVHPVECGSINAMSDYENGVKKVINAVYDDAKAFSLRDRDETRGEIEDIPPVVRMKLSCRTAENLLLTNEVLDAAGSTWEEVQRQIEEWMRKNVDHPRYDAMKSFKAGGYDRKGADLKELRMLLVGGIVASNKPWEVLVGSTLSAARVSADTDFGQEGSIYNFLGEKVSRNLLLGA